MIECSFTFPAEHSKQIRRDMEAELVTHYGGFTRLSAYGSWRGDGGKVVCEVVYYYVVAVGAAGEAYMLHDMIVGDLRLAGEHSMFWKVDHQSTISIEVLS